MKSPRLIFYTFCLALIVTCKSASADLIASESFNYNGGSPFVGVPGSGIGFTTNWVAGGRNATSSGMRTQTGSLTFSGVTSAGNSVTGISSDTQLFGTNRQTSQTFVGASTGQTTWMSFLIRQNVVGGQLGGFGGIYVGNSTNEFDPKLFVGKGGVSNNWLIETLGGTGSVQSTTALTTGQTTLLVVKMETFVGNDRFTLFVNPTNVSEPSGGFVKNDLDVGTANRLTMYNAGSFAFDEIRIGTSFFDVITAVPEPNSSLLVLAGMTLGLLRRKR